MQGVVQRKWPFLCPTVVVFLQPDVCVKIPSLYVNNKLVNIDTFIHCGRMKEVNMKRMLIETGQQVQLLKAMIYQQAYTLLVIMLIISLDLFGIGLHKNSIFIQKYLCFQPLIQREHTYMHSAPSTVTTLCPGCCTFPAFSASIVTAPHNGCCPSSCSLPLYVTPLKIVQGLFHTSVSKTSTGPNYLKRRENGRQEQKGGRNRMRRDLGYVVE